MRNSKNKKIEIIIPITTLISLVGVLLGIGIFVRDLYLETISVQIDAKVLSIDYDNSQRYATVTYNVNEIDYLISMPLDEYKSIAVNDTLTIKYNIHNPATAIYNEHLTEVLIIVLISLLGIVITTNKTIHIIKDYNHLNKLKGNGIKLESNIVDIYIDVTVPRKKEHCAYRIRAKYLNPQDNQEYIFNSAYTYENLKIKYPNYENATITVYLNQTNTNIYYVDLNSIKIKESIKVEDENNRNESVKIGERPEKARK